MKDNMEMLNGLPGMVYHCKNEPGYPFTFVSRGCKMLTGYYTGELGQKSVLDIIHPDDVQEIDQLTAATLSVGLPMESVFRIITKDGAEKSIWVYCQVFDTDDKWMPSIFSGFWIDVSRMMRITNSEGENRSTFNFLAKFSRNIRTPLNTVMGMTELGLREDMPYKVREYTKTVKKAGGELMTILNDILDYASIESGGLDLKKAEYSLTSLLKGIKHTVKDWIADTSLRFNFSVGNNIPDLLIGDEVRLQRIILHLLSNAVKFTDDGMVALSVTGVSSELEGNVTLTIVIEDSGRGIKEEDLENIFKEFVQIDTKNISGTGLGLHITKYLVELMKGDLQVSSMYEIGSVFTFTVTQEVKSYKKMCIFDDYVKPADVSMEFYGLNENASFTAVNTRVLIVDDIELNLKIAAGLLRPYKMTLDLCSNGADAIEAMKNRDYDIIFMDHLMPVMDGLETIAKIREMDSEDSKNVTVIALTANVDQNSKDFYLENGFDDLLPKPIDVHQLNAMIEKWIPEERRQPREQTSQNSQNSQINEMDGACVNIAGVNTNKGIVLAGGNVDNYLPVLKNFHVYVSKLIKKFKTCMEENDLESFRIHANALKSASGNVGADRLYIAAEAFEQAAEEGDISFIRDNSRNFFTELEVILQNIYPAVKDLPEPVMKQGTEEEEKQKILVIDDSPHVLYILNNILKDDYVLLIAKDGELGLTMAKKSKPDLILLDITMPGISGYDVLKALKSEDVTKGISVILISGNDSYEDQIKGYSMGAVEYIQKPFVKDIVKHKIDFNIRHILLERKCKFLFP